MNGNSVKESSNSGDSISLLKNKIGIGMRGQQVIDIILLTKE